MAIKFIDFRKNLSDQRKLELSFSLENNVSLSVIDNDMVTLEEVIKIFNKKSEDYSGEVFVNSENLKNKKNILFLKEYLGLYSNFTLYHNFKYILSLYSKKIKKEELLTYFSDLSLNYKLKFSKITGIEKEKVYLLLSYLLSSEIFLLDLRKYDFFKEENLIIEFIKKIISKQEKNVVLLSSELNSLSSLAQKVLIISDGKQVYYGDKKDLDVVQELVILKLSEFNEEVFRERFTFNFTIVNNKLILEKDNLEAALYYFVSNNIEVLSIKTFNESAELYEGGE